MTSVCRRLAMGLLASALAVAGAAPLSAQTQYSGKIQYVIAPDDRPCAMFRLVGNATFFALPMASPGFEERYAALLLIAVGRQNVTIRTAGSAPECSNITIIDQLFITFP